MESVPLALHRYLHANHPTTHICHLPAICHLSSAILPCCSVTVPPIPALDTSRQVWADDEIVDSSEPRIQLILIAD